MVTTEPNSANKSTVGALLRRWRAARRFSQLDLAATINVSTRHLSCVETGKSKPGRELLIRFSDALALPLRDRNALLLAGGYAPEFRETSLNSAELLLVNRALSAILAQQEPYPAFVLNRRWDIVRANDAAGRIAAYVCGGSRHHNMVRQLFDPTDLRAAIENWEEVAEDLLRHLHDAVAAVPSDVTLQALLNEALAAPGIRTSWRSNELGTAPPPPLLTVVFRKGEERLRFFSTIATFGTARDITLDELRVECVFPADEKTAAKCRALAGAD